MSCIKAVCNASDAAMITAHKEFCRWKDNNPMDRVKTDYSYAMRHYGRSPTRATNVNGFKSTSHPKKRSDIVTGVQEQ